MSHGMTIALLTTVTQPSAMRCHETGETPSKKADAANSSDCTTNTCMHAPICRVTVIAIALMINRPNTSALSSTSRPVISAGARLPSPSPKRRTRRPKTRICGKAGA